MASLAQHQTCGRKRWCVRPESNRHALRRRIFLPATARAAGGVGRRRRLGSGLCLDRAGHAACGSALPVRFRSPPSSLYTRPASFSVDQKRFGVARATPCLLGSAFPCQGFTEFDGFYSRPFARGTPISWKSATSTNFVTDALSRIVAQVRPLDRSTCWRRHAGRCARLLRAWDGSRAATRHPVPAVRIGRPRPAGG